jgi:hypothetical protein
MSKVKKRRKGVSSEITSSISEARTTAQATPTQSYFLGGRKGYDPDALIAGTGTPGDL